MTSLLETAKNLDIVCFYWINQHGNSFTDILFWVLSQGWSWAIVLIGFFGFITLRKDKSNWLYILLGISFCFLLADRISVLCFKETFLRLRPCHALEGVRLFNNHCGGMYGFISSHATNIFALASFLSLSYKHIRFLPASLFIWAGMVAYSRPYLGVHYPLDIVCGAIVGTGIGSLVFFLIYKLKQFVNNKKKN